MSITKYEKTTPATLNRADIHLSDYNPRKITAKAKRDLIKNIQQVGLLGGIVVNKTTMNVVSGHQRITVLDELEGNLTYDLNVSLVELSAIQEMEQNVFMNNKKAQGEYDEKKIYEMFAMDKTLEMQNMGIDRDDALIFGIETKQHKIKEFGFDKDKLYGRDETDGETEFEEDELNEGVFEKDEETGNVKDDFMFLIFDSFEQKETLLKQIGVFEREKYIDEIILNKIIEHGKESNS